MPKLNPLDAADRTAEIIENVYNAYFDSKAPDNEPIEDCYNDMGNAAGYNDGYAFVDNNLNGIPTPEPQISYPESGTICDGVAGPVADDGFFVPAFNPFVAFAEVAFTPTEVAPGTSPYHNYEVGYGEGVDSGSKDAFDSNLDAHFQAYSEPEIYSPPPIDAPVAALDYTPPSLAESYSGFSNTSDYSGSSNDSGSSGSDSGFSSD